MKKECMIYTVYMCEKVSVHSRFPGKVLQPCGHIKEVGRHRQNNSRWSRLSDSHMYP